MPEQSINLGTLNVDPIVLALFLAGLAVTLLVVLIFLVWHHGSERAKDSMDQAMRSHTSEAELAELKGRLRTLSEIVVTRQGELTRSVHDRLDNVGHRLGQNLEANTKQTNDSLTQLQQRLAVIDAAQRNITELSNKVVSLQDVLNNKQSRGAFGQGRMEAIIQDGLPRNSYTFQATLSNGKRPDCLIHLPNNPAAIAIDAKFPLEGFEAFRISRNDQEHKVSAKRIRTDVGKHIEDITAKYLLPGETQDTAIMFVPSEAIYADLHEFFPDLIQKAYRARIVIASPNMLMLAVQTMQAIMKDVKMREAAGLIQREVTHIVDDVHRLRERVNKLQNHFGLVNKDLDQILISSDKISSRGRKIETLDFDYEAEKSLEEKKKTKKKSDIPSPESKLLAGE